MIRTCAFSLLLLVPAAAQPAAAAETAPPSQMQADGRHDFDFYLGTWTIHNRMLKPGSRTEWVEFTSTTTDSAFLNGLGNMDEMTLPHDARGISLRFFDPAKKEWSIYWANSHSGVLELPPVVGRFENGEGNFYSDDVDAQNKPVKVRYHWTHPAPDHLHWDLASSYDSGTTWDVTWTMEFTRG